MIEKPDVDTLMAGPLGEWLSGQDQVRRDAKAQTANRRWLAAMVLGPLAVFVCILAPIDWGVKIWGSVFAAVIAFAWAERPKQRAVRTVKIGINDAIANALGLEYRHDCEPGRAFELARACRLLPAYDRAHFEDSWCGSFGEVPFSLHEAKLEKRQGSGKDKRWVTVFRGVVMSVGYARRFSGTTLLVRDKAFRRFWGGRRDHIEVAGRRLDHAEMTHPGFEDVFDLYTTDQVEARFLIDPVYVERLIALEASYGGSDIASVFDEGAIVVALKSENLFESGSIEASDDHARVATTIDQFARLADLAAALNERGPFPGPRAVS